MSHMVHTRNINYVLFRCSSRRQTEFQIVASTSSKLEEPSSILVNKLPISIGSIPLASNCLRDQFAKFETLSPDWMLLGPPADPVTPSNQKENNILRWRFPYIPFFLKSSGNLILENKSGHPSHQTKVYLKFHQQNFAKLSPIQASVELGQAQYKIGLIGHLRLSFIVVIFH